MKIQKQIILVVKSCKNSLNQISILYQQPKTELIRHAIVQYMVDLGEVLTFFHEENSLLDNLRELKINR